MRRPAGRSKAKRNDGRWVVGIHAARESILVRPKSITKVWVKKSWNRNSALIDLLELVKSKNLPWREVDDGQISKIAQSNQGVALNVSDQPEANWPAIKEAKKSIVMVLDGVEDPHNLGAVMRTAWLMGVSALVVPKNNSVGMTATVAKVASGGAEHVPLFRESDLQSLIGDLKSSGFWVYGLAGASAKPLYSLEFPEKVVWVVGSEDKGLRKTTVQLCDELVAIPQISAGASYNASVAAAIAISETSRQHQTL